MFYDPLFTAMGLTHVNADAESAGYHPPGEPPNAPFVWVVQESTHQPNGTRVAFAAPSRAAVDDIAGIARQSGARAFEAPAIISEYGTNYYAAFFEDADGNKLEVCYRGNV
jgi:hypothetical protein